jgi:hypothetical protein
MDELERAIASLHEQHKRMLADLQRLHAALDILDPQPELRPTPAEDQIKAGILRALKDGPKTQNQLGRILDVTYSRARTIADKMVKGGALESEQLSKTVTSYRIKREELKIVAGEGVRE